MGNSCSSPATNKSGSSSSARGSSFKVSGTGASSGSGSRGGSSSVPGSSSHGGSRSVESSISGSYSGGRTPPYPPIMRLRKPAAVLMDMVGTIMYQEYIPKVVVGYAKLNVKTYLDKEWGNRVLMQDIELLRAKCAQDGGPVVIAPDHEGQKEIISSVVAYVKRCLEECIFHEPMRIFLIHMVFYSLDLDEDKRLDPTDVLPDAVHFLKRSSKAGIQVHIVSRIWSYVVQKFLSKSDHSDLTPYIKSIMDTELGSLEGPATYKTVAKKIGLPTKDIIFFTHSGVRAVAAHQAGLRVFLVATHRIDIDREWTKAVRQRQIQVIRNFDDVALVEDDYDDDYEEVEEDEDDEGPSSEA